MKCEICQKREASVHFKQVSDGEVRELFVCEDCAASKGFDVQAPMSLSNLLFGAEKASAEPSVPAEKEMRCEACGLTLTQFRQHSRLGCVQCYEVFSEELRELIPAMHRGDRHMGKVPEGERVRSNISRLRVELETAVSQQEYEVAADLRDRIKQLKAGVHDR